MIVKINKKALLMIRSRPYFFIHNLIPRTLEIAFNELPDFKFFWGGMPPDPLPKEALRPLVNTVAYSTQTGCLLQTLLKPLPDNPVSGNHQASPSKQGAWGAMDPQARWERDRDPQNCPSTNPKPAREQNEKSTHTL